MKMKIFYIIQTYGPLVEAVDHYGDIYTHHPLISAQRVTKEIFEKSDGREDIVSNRYYKRIYEK